MTKIQLTNLQYKSQLMASELHNIFGGARSSAEVKGFSDSDTPEGALVISVIKSDLPSEEARDIIGFLWNNPGAAIQIVAPL